jgi:hypothetical protein
MGILQLAVMERPTTLLKAELSEGLEWSHRGPDEGVHDQVRKPRLQTAMDAGLDEACQ